MSTVAPRVNPVKLASVVLFHPSMVRRSINPAFGSGVFVVKAATAAEYEAHYLATTFSHEEKVVADRFGLTMEQARELIADGDAALAEAEYDRLRDWESSCDPIDDDEDGASFADELAGAVFAGGDGPTLPPAGPLDWCEECGTGWGAASDAAGECVRCLDARLAATPAPSPEGVEDHCLLCYSRPSTDHRRVCADCLLRHGSENIFDGGAPGGYSPCVATREERPFALRSPAPAEFVRFLPLDAPARPEAAPSRSHVTIKDHGYAVEPIPADPDFGTAAFRVSKADGPDYYVLASVHGTVECDCPDYEFTKVGTAVPCKHGAALIAMGLIAPPTPRGFAPPAVAGPHVRDEFDE